MTQDEIMAEITALKSLLNDTDYNDNKLTESFFDAMSAEGDTLTKLTSWIESAVSEYNEIVSKRQYYRKKINELEEMIPEPIEDNVEIENT